MPGLKYSNPSIFHVAARAGKSQLLYAGVYLSLIQFETQLFVHAPSIEEAGEGVAGAERLIEGVFFSSFISTGKK